MTTLSSPSLAPIHFEPSSRRDVMKAAIAGIAGSTVSAILPLSAGQANAAIPRVEGLFLISENDARIFFIRSSWLPFFEVTDFYADPDKLEKAIKHGRDGTKVKDKWGVLYSDDPTITTTPIGGAAEDLPPPSPGKTYIAMSMTPV